MAARISEYEREHQAAMDAHTFMYGCGNGGTIFDEAADPVEALNALTDDEREQQNNGLYAPDPEDGLSPEMVKFLRDGESGPDDSGPSRCLQGVKGRKEKITGKR